MESFPFFPVTCSCHLFQKITAVTDSRGRCCTEWDDCFSCKVILFYKVIYWPCCNSPPDRIVKCSQFPSCVDFTGFNGIQNCVYCYYLSFFSKIALKHRLHKGHSGVFKHLQKRLPLLRNKALKRQREQIQAHR